MFSFIAEKKDSLNSFLKKSGEVWRTGITPNTLKNYTKANNKNKKNLFHFPF